MIKANMFYNIQFAQVGTKGFADYGILQIKVILCFQYLEFINKYSNRTLNIQHKNEKIAFLYQKIIVST